MGAMGAPANRKGAMKITVEQGIDARPFQQLMYDLATAGQEAQDAARRKKLADLAKLAPKAQRGLFDEDENERGRR